MADADVIVTDLTTDQCWELLRRNSFARIGYSLRSQIHVVPINYVVSGDRLVFRTATDSKFMALRADDQIGFETDEVDDTSARSVLAQGRAVELTDDHEAAAATQGLRPWVPTAKNKVFAIEIDELSGRAFVLDR